LASGATQVGLKLGFTNKAVWNRFGLDSPFWSPIYDDTVWESRVPSLDGLVAPRIEPEIVLGFHDELHPGASMGDIVTAIGWAALGFEIVQCHYAGWEMSPADAIADGGLHGLLVLGKRVTISAAEARQLAAVTVDLRREGVSVAKGSGAQALGGPAEAIRWLLQLPGVDVLNAGAIVTTGTLTAAMPISSSESWQLLAQGPVALGTLEVSLC
jgi:2-oxo-3-hexenedioate decarboxylase